jgi:hypothetical protein
MEKLVHWPSLKKEIRTSLYLRGLVVADSTESILCRVNFCAHLEGNPPSPLKMMLMMFLGSWKS